jgi:hypothetical protein
MESTIISKPNRVRVPVTAQRHRDGGGVVIRIPSPRSAIVLDEKEFDRSWHSFATSPSRLASCATSQAMGRELDGLYTS